MTFVSVVASPISYQDLEHWTDQILQSNQIDVFYDKNKLYSVNKKGQVTGFKNSQEIVNVFDRSGLLI